MFDLKEFKAKVHSPQRSNKYSLFINHRRPGLEDVHVLAEQVMFPTFAYDKLGGSYRYGYGVRDSFPGTPEYKELIVNFIMQQGSEEYGFFHEWFNEIVKKDPPASGSLHSVNRESFTLGYKDDYVAQMELHLHGDSAEAETGKWEIKDAFPINITGDPLAWDQSDKYMSFFVTFNFYSMKFVPGRLPQLYRNLSTEEAQQTPTEELLGNPQ